MAVERTPWGDVGGRAAHLYAITNARGTRLTVSDYGARATALSVASPSGAKADVLLGFDRPAAYQASPAYIGATIGRFANRLRGGRFVLDGAERRIPCNDGENALHGGPSGFDQRVWSADFDEAGDGVVFSMTSPDGDQGFPGQLSVSSEYTLTDDTVVRIDLCATASKPTLCNLANHSYFNLAGHAAGDSRGQELLIEADFYAPVDAGLIPSGQIVSVEGGPFDFRGARPIGQSRGGAYDENFCVRGEAGRLRRAAVARDPASGRGFEYWTTEPGLQLYTGGKLDEPAGGKDGAAYGAFAGFALESQRFPDGPNLSHVPQSRLDPGEVYHHVIEWRFFT